MSSISIRPNRVKDTAEVLAQNSLRLSEAIDRLHALRSSTDSKVLSRRDLSSRINTARHSMELIQTRIKELEALLVHSANQYSYTDNYLNSEATAIIARSEKNSSKNDPFSIIKSIATVFDSINDLFSDLDNAVVGSQLLSVAYSSLLARKLKINYIGVKPTLLQKVMGKYKFTVTADASWLSRSGYSSRIAKMLSDFSRSSPTSKIMSQVHRFVTSYNNPSAMLKHAAGFTKNSNAAMLGSTLLGKTASRMKVGAIDSVSILAKNKGWMSVSKRLPVAGQFISAAAHASEFFDTDKSIYERTGRFTAGVTSDIIAISAGVKIGATIGSIGGPVGIIVGGAVGGLAGGILSSKYGDDIKAVGEKVGSAIEEGVKNLSTKFTSIKSWFN